MKKDFDTINEMSAVYNRCVVDAYIVDIKALEEKQSKIIERVEYTFFLTIGQVALIVISLCLTCRAVRNQ